MHSFLNTQTGNPLFLLNQKAQKKKFPKRKRRRGRRSLFKKMRIAPLLGARIGFAAKHRKFASQTPNSYAPQKLLNPFLKVFWFFFSKKNTPPLYPQNKTGAVLLMRQLLFRLWGSNGRACANMPIN